MNNRQIQTVTLKLADGRVLQYSGPAQVWGDELQHGNVRIRSIEISLPRDLPDGSFFENVGGSDEAADQRSGEGDGG